MIFATQRAANPPPFTGFSAIARSVMIFAIIDMLDVNMDDKFQCYSSYRYDLRLLECVPMVFIAIAGFSAIARSVMIFALRCFDCSSPFVPVSVL